MKYLGIFFIFSSCTFNVNKTIIEDKHFQCMCMCEKNRESEFANKFYSIMKKVELKCYAECTRSFQ